MGVLTSSRMSSWWACQPVDLPMPVQSNDVQHFLTSFALPVQSSWLVFQLSLAWATCLHKGESQVFPAGGNRVPPTKIEDAHVAVEDG